MSQCPRCGAGVTCGCAFMTATDGTQGCNKCIPAYMHQQTVAQQQSQALLQQLQQSQGSQILSGPH